MAITGPDFIALQVADLKRSASFYATELGLPRAERTPPGAVVFDTGTVSFAVREPLPGVTPGDVRPWAGAGVALWLGSDDAQGLHDSLSAAGTEIVAPPVASPFGLMFTFADPDGYRITVHQAG